MKIKLRKLTFILLNALTLLPLVVCADVYVTTDQQGVTHFSDTPEPGAKSMSITEAQSYSAPVLPVVDKPMVKQNTKLNYKNLTIVKPVDGETIDSGKQGDLAVKVVALPALKNGDKFCLMMDGKILITHKQTVFKLKNIDRGSHVLQVQIVDAQDKILINSSAITFQMQRAKKSHSL